MQPNQYLVRITEHQTIGRLFPKYSIPPTANIVDNIVPPVAYIVDSIVPPVAYIVGKIAPPVAYVVGNITPPAASFLDYKGTSFTIDI